LRSIHEALEAGSGWLPSSYYLKIPSPGTNLDWYPPARAVFSEVQPEFIQYSTLISSNGNHFVTTPLLESIRSGLIQY